MGNLVSMDHPLAMALYALPVVFALLRRIRRPNETWWTFGLVAITLTAFQIFHLPIIGWLIATFLSLRGLDPRAGVVQPGDDGSHLEPGWKPPPFQPPNVVPTVPRRRPDFSSARSFDAPSIETPPVCPRCGGTGRVTCPKCMGNATWFYPPTSASGTGTPGGCEYCCRSGTVQCLDCRR